MTEEQIFAQAIQLASPERAEFLDGVYLERPDERAKMEAMLRAHEAGDSLLDAEHLASTEHHEQNGLHESLALMGQEQIRNYKLLQRIGEGGFGIVYMAEQIRPVKRKVALKVIKPGMDSATVVSRFEAERQALALMEHSNIARVFDGGTTEQGRPYFVMELVKGVPITTYCDDNRLKTDDRLKLFMHVCKAVQHAHHKGIIHRDLKPSNVMVTLHDGQPVPKVIDFGVAKAIHTELTEKTLFTAYGQMIGTPQYMSPEQAEMSGLDVDTRSDVYSLGVLLYELLTGSTPLEAEVLRKAGFVGMQQAIKETEPPKPSARLSSSGDKLTHIAAHRSVSTEKLSKELRGDLDWIVMKAIEKDRTRRYDSPGRFEDDLQRYLNQEAIEARPPTIAYRLSKTWQQNRAVLSWAAALFAVLSLGLFVLWSKNQELEDVLVENGKKQVELETAMQSWREELLDRGIEAALRGDDLTVEYVVSSENSFKAKLPEYWRLMLRGLAAQFGGQTLKAQKLHDDALSKNQNSVAIKSALAMSMINRTIDQNRWQDLTIELAASEIQPGPYRKYDELLYGWSLVYVDPHKSVELLRNAVDRPWPIGNAMLAQAMAHSALDKTDSLEAQSLAREALEHARQAEQRADNNPFVISIGLFTRCVAIQILGPNSVDRTQVDSLAEFMQGKPNLWQGANILTHYYALVNHPKAFDQFKTCLDEDWAGACAVGYLFEHGIEIGPDDLSAKPGIDQPFAAVAAECIDVEATPDKAEGKFLSLRRRFKSLYLRTYALEIFLHAGDVVKAQQEAKVLLGSITEEQAPFAEGSWACSKARLELIAGKLSKAEIESRVTKSAIFTCYGEHIQGLIARAEGQHEAAESHFKAVVESGQFYIPQYYMARALLAREYAESNRLKTAEERDATQ